MKKPWIVIGLVLLLIAACVSWFLIRTPDFLRNMFPGKAGIQSGSYARILHSYAKPTPVAVAVIRLDIDRDKGLAVFHLQDGSSVQAALAGEDAVRWARGCHTMSDSTKMEYLPLAVEHLVLGDATFEHPYLEGTCPAPPYNLVLGEGPRDPAGISDSSACDWYKGAKCVYFGLEYVTLHVQICDRETDTTLPQASLTLETPAGRQVFPAQFQVKLAGDARYPVTVSAPGYATFQGDIQVGDSQLVVWTATGEGETPQASTIVKVVSPEAANLNLCLDKAGD